MSTSGKFEQPVDLHSKKRQHPWQRRSWGEDGIVAAGRLVVPPVSQFLGPSNLPASLQKLILKGPSSPEIILGNAVDGGR